MIINYPKICNFNILIVVLALIFICCNLCQKVYSQTTADSAHFENLATSYLRTNQLAKAVECLEQAEKINPTSSRIHTNLGVIYAKLQRYTDAIKQLNSAIEIKPDNGNAWLNLADTYKLMGDKKKATETYLMARKTFSSDLNLITQIDRSLVSMGQTIPSSTKSSVTSILDKANELFKSGRKQESIDFLKTESFRLPNNSVLKYQTARLAALNHDWKEALSSAKETIKLNPNSPENWLLLINAQVGAGELDALQDSYKEFVKRFPDHHKTPSIKDQITYYGKDLSKIKMRESQGLATEEELKEIAVYLPSDMPLKVYVPNTADIFNSNMDEQKYASLLDEALQEWSNASGGAVKFRYTNDSDIANIVCTWTSNKNKISHSFAAGQTSFGYNSEDRPRRKIVLLIAPADKEADSNEFYDAALHELGHALGLSHSSNHADVMFMSGQMKSSSFSQRASLSTNDRNRINALYNNIR